jgi:hypothetical protein
LYEKWGEIERHAAQSTSDRVRVRGGVRVKGRG